MWSLRLATAPVRLCRQPSTLFPPPQPAPQATPPGVGTPFLHRGQFRATPVCHLTARTALLAIAQSSRELENRVARLPMTGDVCWLGLLIIASLVWLAWVWRRRLHPLSHTAVISPRIQRLLRPRTPHDCPACRQVAAAPTHAPPTCPPIIPYSERKSRRGAPKRIATQGFACPNRSCMYYRITDAHIHALVGDGAEGKAERIDFAVSSLWYHLQHAT